MRREDANHNHPIHNTHTTDKNNNITHNNREMRRRRKKRKKLCVCEGIIWVR